MRVTRFGHCVQITLFSRLFPINCYVVQEDDGLTLVDTGISAGARDALGFAGHGGRLPQVFPRVRGTPGSCRGTSNWTPGKRKAEYTAYETASNGAARHPPGFSSRETTPDRWRSLRVRGTHRVTRCFSTGVAVHCWRETHGRPAAGSRSRVSWCRGFRFQPGPHGTGARPCRAQRHCFACGHRIWRSGTGMCWPSADFRFVYGTDSGRLDLRTPSMESLRLCHEL